MTLEARPSDAEILRRKQERESRGRAATVATAHGQVALGPGSPLLQLGKKKVAPVLPDDPLDPGGRMNITERRRAFELEAKRRAGAIRSWEFEAIALILADRTRYHPDFLVEENDRSITLEEVKGRWYDDARVKIKVAARRFPYFRFRALRPLRKAQGGGWHVEDIKP